MQLAASFAIRDSWSRLIYATIEEYSGKQMNALKLVPMTKDIKMVTLKNRRAHLWFALLLSCAMRCGGFHADEALASRVHAPLTILQMNDVYSTTPIDDGKAGGLARVATLAAQL